MFAGRKIHPFFSLWKVEKKNQEQERGLSAAKREGGGITCGPIHVFENVQDDASPLDWSDWTFLGMTTIADLGPGSSNLSALEGSVESLNFDNFPSALNRSSASISQNAMSCPSQLSIQPDSMLEISPPNSAVLANEQPVCPLEPEDAKVDLDLELNEVNTFLGHTGIFRKSDTEPLSKFLQESMGSYYHSCEGKAEGSLWIHKYKPTKAFEVCGNEGAMNFLRDWLHLWHERRYQCRKDSSNRDRGDRQNDDDADYICSDNEEDSLQNVLLITGPTGSGKSAAVYACAQEQGFKVLERSASDCRNGAAVKQYFGEALESHGVKRLLDHTVNSHKKKTVKLLPAPALPNGIAAEEMDDGVIELITISDDEAHSLGGASPRLHDKSNVFTRDSVQTLILIEDVDILFPEDRGCIAAIQHISETAKGPIILTSNSNNAGLPDSFARLHVSFSLPLPDELLCHMYMVCVTEEVNINPLLLKKFVQSCDGDIRKTIMQLQFWFQSEKYRKDRKLQKVYGSLPFDLEACHQIVPKILPWNYPSELSKLIEKEVAKSITMMEETSCLQGLFNKDLDINERKNDLDVQCMETDYLEARVERTKRSLIDCSEFESQHNAISELSNCSGCPVTSSWQKSQSKLIVMSSDSEVKDPNNGHALDVHDEAYKRHSLDSNSESPCKFQWNQTYPSTSFCKLVCSALKDSEEERYKYYDACLNETHKSFDISCFPGSIFVPETAIQHGMKTVSGPGSSGCNAGPVEVSLNNELTPFTFSVSQCLAKLPQNYDSLTNSEIPIPSPKVAVQDCRDENTETTTVCNVMYECSHADFKLNSKYVEASPSMAMDMVQNFWKKLRVCRKDLGQHANPEQPGCYSSC
ncbi:ATPase family AAA domain-containing protein 5 [Spatholobus suberectus]|nr:ATPase family AAA domain-containing protein 5 [Spatholobus suberectus]